MLHQDPIVEQFVKVYGIRRLMEDLGLEKIRKMDQYLMALCPFHENSREPDFQIHSTLGVYNCLAGETRVITKYGVKEIRDLIGQQVLLDSSGYFVDAEIKSFGHQQLFNIKVTRNGVSKILRATSNHRWFVNKGTHKNARLKEFVTSQLKPGDKLAVKFSRFCNTTPSSFGVAHGFTYGDGEITHRSAAVTLFGDKDSELLKYYQQSPTSEVETPNGIKGTRVANLPRFFKEKPSLDESTGYLYGWLAGYFAADGCVDENGYVVLNSANREDLEFARTVATLIGIGTYGIRYQLRKGFKDVPTPLYSVGLMANTLRDEFFIISKHRERFLKTCRNNYRPRPGWIVRSVTITDDIEEVFCAVVPKTHNFALEDNILTGNCFGCCSTGNLYTFVHKMYGIPFKDANVLIARLAGFDSDINIEDIKFASELRNLFVTTPDEKDSKRPTITKKLIAQMDTGSDPYNYLLGRGFSEETIKYFECTFTNRWGPVWHENINDWCYEERVIIPGHDKLGEVIGFIARTPVNDEPKYRYLKGYPKSKTLFNLHRAKAYADQGLILVEGPLDVMQLHNLGFPNVVAIYGASLSAAQVQLVSECTNRVWLMFDNDKAGRTATIKAIEDLKDLVDDLNVCGLGPFKDPGEMRSYDDGIKVIKGAVNWFKFNLTQSLLRK